MPAHAHPDDGMASTYTRSIARVSREALIIAALRISRKNLLVKTSWGNSCAVLILSRGSVLRRCGGNVCRSKLNRSRSLVEHQS